MAASIAPAVLTEEEATEEEAAKRIKPTVNQKGDGGGGF
jgi:hypothetical protein